MEERKLIRLGKTSTVISLPMEWLEQRKLKVGEKVYMEPLKDGGLSVKARPAEASNEMTIRVDEGFSPISIEKLVTAAYLNGADRMTVESRKFTKRQVETLHKMVSNLMGMELMDENSGSVVMQCFLAEDLPLDNVISRMRAMIKSFFTDMKSAFAGRDLELLRSIPERDWGLNKLHHFAKRQLYKTLVSPKDMTLQEVIFYIGFIDRIERIADYLKKIAVAADRTEAVKLMGRKESDAMFRLLGEVLSNFGKVPLFLAKRDIHGCCAVGNELDALAGGMASELDRLVLESGGKKELFKSAFFESADRIRGHVRLLVDESIDVLVAGKSEV